MLALIGEKLKIAGYVDWKARMVTTPAEAPTNPMDAEELPQPPEEPAGDTV